MRIATWNVNSLKARLEKVTWWLDRAKPDVLLMQETKLADRDAPVDVFRQAGYALVHHGEGRWNGVAIASRCGLDSVITNFGEPLRPARTPDIADDDPLAEARMISAECSGIRVVCIYAPNGRIVGSPFYEAKLAWFDRLAGWLNEAIDATTPVRSSVFTRPTAAALTAARGGRGGRGTQGRAAALRDDIAAGLCRGGLVDAYRLRHSEQGRYTWWDYRAGNFHMNFGMRIDHLLVTTSLKPRIVWAEIDREARKGKPVPSDHAPLVIDIDEPGFPFDAGWASADERIAGRRARPN